MEYLQMISLIAILIVIIIAIGHLGKRLIKSEGMQAITVILIGLLSSTVIIWSYLEILIYLNKQGIKFNLANNINTIIGTNEFSFGHLLFNFLFPGAAFLFMIVCCSISAYHILFGKFKYFIYPLLALISAYVIIVNEFYISIITIFILAIVVFIINSCMFRENQNS